jgi:RimJ/RimL family protein N-acetyltransferase
MSYPEDVPVLTDGDVTLRAYTLDDLDGVVETCTDPDMIAWTTVPTPYTSAEGVEWITKHVPDMWAEGNDYGFVIEAAHPDGVRRYSGGISLRLRADGVAEIGFGVHPAVRGAGVCRRAVKLLADWAFSACGVEVLVWYAQVGNWASRRVVWANGFSFDGMIAQYLMQRGTRKDAWVGTLRASDSREPKNIWWIPPVLESERIRLRPFADADAARLFELFHDERSKHFGGRVSGVVQTDGAAQLLRIREQNATGRMINWCVADRVSDQLIGHMQLFDLEGLDDSEVKPGYSIHPDARGRGILTEALGLLVDWTFRPVAEGGFGKRRITISTAGTNAASRHAAERAGFTHIATHPLAFTIGESDFDDEVIYHRLNPTWVK